MPGLSRWLLLPGSTKMESQSPSMTSRRSWVGSSNSIPTSLKSFLTHGHGARLRKPTSQQNGPRSEQDSDTASDGSRARRFAPRISKALKKSFKHPTAKKPLPYEDDLHSYVPTASNPPTSTRSNRAPIVAAPDPRYEKLQHSYVPTPSNPPTSTWSSRAPIVAAPDPRYEKVQHGYVSLALNPPPLAPFNKPHRGTASSLPQDQVNEDNGWEEFLSNTDHTSDLSDSESEVDAPDAWPAEGRSGKKRRFNDEDTKERADKADPSKRGESGAPRGGRNGGIGRGGRGGPGGRRGRGGKRGAGGGSDGNKAISEADQENDSKKFACPFYKLDPVTHFSCLTRQDLSQTNHVRQHLNRSHVASQQCPTCHITFEKTADWNRHVRGRGCEPPAAGTSYTNMTADQSDKISRLPRNYNAKERWYMMWDVLFPGMPRPPSPYVDDIRVECTRGPLIDFFKANGLSRLLEGARQAQSPGEEAILLAELIVTFMQNQINHHVPVGTLPAPPAAVAPALVMESSPPEPHDRLDNPPLDGDVVPMGLDPPNQSFDGDAVIVSLDSHNPGIGEDTTPFQITQNFQGTQASQSAPTFLPPPMMSGAQSAGWANTMASGNMNLGQVPNTTLASSQFAFPSYDYRETIFQDSWNERLAPVSSSSPGTLLSTEHMAAPAAAGVMDSAGDLFSPTAGFGENSFPPLPVDPYPQPAQGNGDMGYATVTGFASFDLHSGNSLAQTSNGGPFSIPDDPSWSEEADLSMEGFGLDGTHPARPPHGPS